MGIIAVDIGSERSRNDAGGNGLVREAVGEVAAVADVDPQPPIKRRLDHRMHFAFAIDEATGVPREWMGQHIAGPKQRDHPCEDRIDVLTIIAALRQAPQLPEMHVDGQIGATPNLGCHFDDANAPAREAPDFGMRLDAANEVTVCDRRLHGGVDIDAIGTVEVRIVMSFQSSDQIGREESVGTRLRLLGNVVPEAGQGHAGGPALIDQRRDAGLDPDHVGIHAEAAGDILIDMGVGVDQPRQHDLAGHVDHFPCAARQDVGLHDGNLAVADGDILQAVDARRRIDDAASAQKQVEAGAD